MSESGFLSGLLASTPAPAAVEITARRINAVSLAAGTHGHRARDGAAARGSGDSVAERDERARSRRAVGGDQERGRCVCRRGRGASPWCCPTQSRKSRCVRFEKTPPRTQDLDQLIKWQMRKAAPFRIEDAQIAWSESGPIEGGGREYLVVLARRDIVESYERAVRWPQCTPVSSTSRRSTSSTRRSPMQPSGPAGDWLLIHMAPGYATIAVVRSGRIMFFRNRQSEDAADTDLDELVHQTAMYHEDRLGGAAFTRVVLSGATTQGGDSVERTRRQIEERLRVKVEMLDVLRDGVTLRDRIAASPELIDSLTPAVGVLLREDRCLHGRARSGWRDDSHQPLDPSVLQRACRPPRHRRRRRSLFWR